MKVKVIAVTASLVEGIETAEDLIVYIARVSNPNNQMNTATAPKLLRYLIDNKHWSPFDMANLTVEVTTSRVIAQQILRHWSIKPQEFSQRYATVTEIEPIELRMQGETNRQGGEKLCNNELMNQAVDEHIENSISLYRSLLNYGVAKESARFVLPLATSTTLYLNGSIRSWIHYLEQRLDAHAQKEHRLVAQEIEKIFGFYFPNVWKAIQLKSQ